MILRNFFASMLLCAAAVLFSAAPAMASSHSGGHHNCGGHHDGGHHDDDHDGECRNDDDDNDGGGHHRGGKNKQRSGNNGGHHGGDSHHDDDDDDDCSGGGEQTDCRFTQGYWQNRAINAGDLTTEIWLALRDIEFYASGKTYGQVLAVSPRGNAYWILARQMVAAQANLINGADPTGAPAEALALADALLSTLTPAQVAAMPKHRQERKDLIQLAGVLDKWNSGQIGTGLCNVGEPPH